jgi:hypothetical protein
MKLEFLPEGSKDCPLIRLYVFDQSAVLRLKELSSALATGATTRAALHEQPWIEAVDGCELELCLGGRDRGILQTGPSKFECVLSKDGWSEIVGLLDPFCNDHADAYQWLDSNGKISLLISSRGTW